MTIKVKIKSAREVIEILTTPHLLILYQGFEYNINLTSENLTSNERKPVDRNKQSCLGSVFNILKFAEKDSVNSGLTKYVVHIESYMEHLLESSLSLSILWSFFHYVLNQLLNIISFPQTTRNICMKLVSARVKIINILPKEKTCTRAWKRVCAAMNSEQFSIHFQREIITSGYCTRRRNMQSMWSIKTDTNIKIVFLLVNGIESYKLIRRPLRALHSWIISSSSNSSSSV